VKPGKIKLAKKFILISSYNSLFIMLNIPVIFAVELQYTKLNRFRNVSSKYDAKRQF